MWEMFWYFYEHILNNSPKNFFNFITFPGILWLGAQCLLSYIIILVMSTNCQDCLCFLPVWGSYIKFSKFCCGGRQTVKIFWLCHWLLPTILCPFSSTKHNIRCAVYCLPDSMWTQHKWTIKRTHLLVWCAIVPITKTTFPSSSLSSCYIIVSVDYQMYSVYTIPFSCQKADPQWGTSLFVRAAGR